MATAHTDDGVPIWYELEGTGPVVVLLPGRGDSSDMFPRCFTDPLRAAGYCVLRLDPRDTGLSGDGGDTYTMSTLGLDALTVMDHAGVDRAHMVGFSMGGIILTELAAENADRVLSCTFIAAMSPDPDAGIGEDFFASMDESDPMTAILHGMGTVTDNDRRFVEEELRRASQRAPARPEAANRHQAAAFRLGWPDLDLLAAIQVPAVAIHGTADRSLPIAHARAFEREIPACQAHLLGGMGHLPNHQEWLRIAELTASHIRTVDATT